MKIHSSNVNMVSRIKFQTHKMKVAFGLNRDTFQNETVEDLNNRYDFRDTKVVGKSFLTDKATGRRIPVAITRDDDSKNIEVYRIVELNKDFIDTMGAGYIKLVHYKDHEFIQKMASQEPHKKGVGTLLHQIAIERSMQLGKGGNVKFEADYNSEPFHYKTGYRVAHTDDEDWIKDGEDNSWVVTSKMANERIKNIIEEAEKNGEIPDSENKIGTHCEFEMPKDNLLVWKETISESPCLKANY